jgi:hypothetical protein
LGSSNVSIATSATTGGNGDIFVNSAVAWSANKLTLSAHRNININANLNATSTASLALVFGQNAVAGGNTSNITTAPGAVVNLPAGTTNFTTRQGSDGAVKQYTVITSLGLAGSTTTTDLQGMGGNLGVGINYALGSNIDATPTALWNGGAGFMPIGSSEAPSGRPFVTTFDGLGHTISNLTINRPLSDGAGLFGRSTNSSSIRNVSLVDARVTGRSNAGGLVGVLAGNSTIWNSNSTGGATVATFKAGGLVGSMLGDASNKASSVSQSYATGTVSGMNNTGGLVGSMGVNTSVSNSYATGAVASTGTNAGGLVGGLNGTISNSYATGAVSGKINVGGLVGLNQGAVSTSYAKGATAGNSNVGELVGGNDVGAGATIVNSYSGLTDAQMQQKSNFSGFDFTVTPVWGKNAAINNGHPILCVFGSCIATISVFAVPVTGFSTYGSTPVFTYRVVDVNGGAFTLINAVLGGIATNNGAPSALSNAGNYSFSYLSGLSLTGSGASDYVLAPSTASVGWTVNKATATVTANSANVTYNGLDQSVSGFSATGLVNNQAASVLTGVSASGSGTNAGSYNVIATGTDSNYNLTLNNGTLNIGKANVSVTGMAAASRDYNGTDIATLTGGTVNGETLGFSGQSGRFDTPSVGRGKVVTVSDLMLVNGSGLASNYNLLQQSGLSADINFPAVAQNVVKTLASKVLSLAGTRAGAGDLSTNVTVIPSPSTNVNTSPNAVMPSNASGSGQAVADVTLRIGNNGSTLQIVSGGILLPVNLPLLDEEDNRHVP